MKISAVQFAFCGSDFLAPALKGGKSEHKTYCTNVSGFWILNPPGIYPAISRRGAMESGKAGQRLKIGVQQYTHSITIPGRSGFSSQPYRYAYQGQFAERNSVTQNLDFRQRSYDPRIGRWTTTDPLITGYSAYEAMGNNPVVYVDPLGADDI